MSKWIVMKVVDEKYRTPFTMVEDSAGKLQWVMNGAYDPRAKIFQSVEHCTDYIKENFPREKNVLYTFGRI